MAIVFGFTACTADRAATSNGDADTGAAETRGDSAAEDLARSEIADAPAADVSDVETDLYEGPPEFEVVLIEAGGPGVGRSPIVTAGRIYHESAEAGIVSGECVYYPALLPPFCDPPCAIGTICLDDDACGAPPEPIGAGDITVTGAEVGITLHPETQYFYYVPTLTPEPVDGDLFAPDARLVTRAQGGNVPAFELEADGVEDLVTPLACPPALSADEDLVVTWQAGDGGNVHLDIESGNHAGQFARIACDSPDDGQIVVDGALIASYLLASRPLDLWRLARENIVAAGRARLYVASQMSCRW